MLIKKLILFNYKWLVLTGITELIFTPVKNINIILGSNGSGKTSTMRQLNPLPGNSSDFIDNGFKEIHIIHNNNEYILTSNKIGVGRHEFILNGVNINDGRTYKQQLKLVEEHFNINQKSISIMLGNISLTKMSTTARKELFNDISSSDYTYGLGLFNKIKDRKKELSNVIKYIKSEITIVESKMLSPNEHLKIHNEIIELKEKIKELNKSKTPIKTVKSFDINKFEKTLDVGENILNKLSDVNVLNLNDELLKYNNEKYHLEVNKKEFESKLKELYKLDNSLLTNNLSEKIKKVFKVKQDILTNNVFNITEEMIVATVDSFKNIYNVIHELLSLHKEYYIKDYGYTEFDNDKNVISNITNKMLIYNKDIGYYEARILNMEKLIDNNTTECPKCGHSWVRDYDEVQHNDWTNSVNELNLKISKLEKLKTEINVKVEAFEQRITVYTRINMLKKQHGSEMNKVLNYIFGDYTISSDPVTLFENLNNVNAKMTKLEEYSQVNTQLIKLERDHHVYAENLKIFEKYGGESVDELEKKLILINNKTLTVIGKIKYINEKIKLFTNLKQIREDITNQMRDRRRALIYEKVNKINNQLDVSISKTTILLDDLQRRLSEVNYNRRNHNALMLKLESHENKYNVVSDIYDALSPNKGVIGELMTSVINSFITDMNLFIADVWSYKLEIQEMVPSEKGLDFKFKVNVKDSEIINDISQLSSSMQDIIDLAFVLTYSKYVGFEAMPVFLDEFGSTFDTEHLHTAYNVLDSLNDGDRQIFLITHHDTVFTRFGEKADIHVIDVKNLNIADSISYNNNFKLRR